MPTEFWYPISTATHDLPYDQWTLGAGANKNVATTVGGGRAGPATHDDDTSYITDGSGGGGLNRHQSVNIDWPGPMSAFVSANADIRSRTTPGASTRTLYMANAGGTLGTAILSVATDDVAYLTSGTAFTDAHRPAGGAWVPSDFSDDQTTFATVLVSVANNTVVTSIWGDITYTSESGGGGFVFLLGLAGAMAAPIAGAMDFAHFTRFLSWRRHVHPRHTIMTGDEVRRAWDDIRAYRHPRYFMPRFA